MVSSNISPICNQLLVIHIQSLHYLAFDLSSGIMSNLNMPTKGEYIDFLFYDNNSVTFSVTVYNTFANQTKCHVCSSNKNVKVLKYKKGARAILDMFDSIFVISFQTFLAT